MQGFTKYHTNCSKEFNNFNNKEAQMQDPHSETTVILPVTFSVSQEKTADIKSKSEELSDRKTSLFLTNTITLQMKATFVAYKHRPLNFGCTQCQEMQLVNLFH